MRLITDGDCSHNHEATGDVSLPFTHLKRIAWTGLRTVQEFSTLQLCLKLNADHLVEIELNLVSWDAVEGVLDEHGVDNIGGYFAHEVLQLPSGSKEVKFPALRVLSLTAVDLTLSSESMFYAMNISSLRSLHLRHCPSWEALIQHASQSTQSIRLQVLHIQSCEGYELGNANEIILGFVAAFEGLKELFISTSSPTDTMNLWHSLIRHKSTLRRFVHHQTQTDDDDESDSFECLIDSPQLALSGIDMAELDKKPPNNPFSNLDLEFIGLCALPPLVVRIVSQNCGGVGKIYLANWKTHLLIRNLLFPHSQQKHASKSCMSDRRFQISMVMT